MTFVMHLSPANLSGYETCKYRTKECTLLCLNTAGRGGMTRSDGINYVQRARVRRTRLFFEHRETFLAMLVSEIEACIKYASRKGYKPCFRLNATSDITFERFEVIRHGTRFKSVFYAFPEIQFYDYTKYPRSGRATDIPNYHLTFSLAETVANRRNAQAWLDAGNNVAAVFEFHGRYDSPFNFPRAFLGKRTVNGDTSDLRFLDAASVVVALKAKGKARKSIGGFVIPYPEMYPDTLLG